MQIKTEIRELLEQLGLDRTEMRIYMSLLDLGTGTASTIAERAKVNRITAYEALKRLSKKGFVLIRAKKGNSIKYFTPAEYPDLIAKLKHQETSVRDAIKKAQSLESDFLASFGRLEDKPTVLYFEGTEGIETVLNDTLKVKYGEILSFASTDSLMKGFDKKFLETYWRRRVELRIRTRGIVPRTEKAVKEFSEARNTKELRTLRFVSATHFPFQNEIDIYGDNVGITSHEKGSEHGIIIRSRSIAQSLKAIFELLWNMSK